MSDHIHVIPMSAIVLTIALVGALLSWRLPVVAIIAVAGLFVWSTVDLQSGYFVPGTRARAGQNDIINTLTAAARLPGVSTACVGWDPGPDHALDYNYYNDRFLIPAQQFQWLTPDQNTPPCGSLMVSADPNLATIYPGARIITSENFVNQSLWAVPLAGDGTYAALAAAGWLSPPAQGANATVALPPDDLKGAGFLVTPPGDFTITPARATDVTVTITHQPGGAPWPNLDALHASSAVFAVRLAVRWYTPEGTAPPGVAALCSTNPGSPVPVACPNWDLPQTLLPGQQAEIPIQLTAFDATGRPLAPGTYIVHLGLYQEGVASFTDLGLNLRVLVTGP
jgi:hypothetical protein